MLMSLAPLRLVWMGAWVIGQVGWLGLTVRFIDIWPMV